LVSRHASDKLVQWDTGRRAFTTELIDLNVLVTNLVKFSPFPGRKLIKASSVVKPKFKEGNYTWSAQLTGSIGSNTFDRAVEMPGFLANILEAMLTKFS